MKTKIVFMTGDPHNAMKWLELCNQEHHLCAHAITRPDQIKRMDADVYVIEASARSQEAALNLVLTVRMDNPKAKVVLMSSWPEVSLYNVFVACNELTGVMPHYLDSGSPDAFDRLERMIIHDQH